MFRSPTTLGLHAGEGETSEMLCLRPGLVNTHRRTPGSTGDTEAALGELREGGLRSATKDGVLGALTHAAAGRGARNLNALADNFAATLRRDADGS